MEPARVKSNEESVPASILIFLSRIFFILLNALPPRFLLCVHSVLSCPFITDYLHFSFADNLAHLSFVLPYAGTQFFLPHFSSSFPLTPTPHSLLLLSGDISGHRPSKPHFRWKGRILILKLARLFPFTFVAINTG